MSYKDQSFETLCLLHWSDDLLKIYIRTLRDYTRWGSPPIPITEYNYRKKFKRKHRRRKRE